MTLQLAWQSENPSADELLSSFGTEGDNFGNRCQRTINEKLKPCAANTKQMKKRDEIDRRREQLRRQNRGNNKRLSLALLEYSDKEEDDEVLNTVDSTATHYLIGPVKNLVAQLVRFENSQQRKNDTVHFDSETTVTQYQDFSDWTERAQSKVDKSLSLKGALCHSGSDRSI